MSEGISFCGGAIFVMMRRIWQTMVCAGSLWALAKRDMPVQHWIPDDADNPDPRDGGLAA
jgi:hypothetical protein